jgi:predicted alpha/beta-hydrolase family hydrolase
MSGEAARTGGGAVDEHDALPLLLDGRPDATLTLVLAHGAGAPMDHPSLAAIAEGVAAAGIRVARFEFPYMRARRADGRRRAPDAPLRLLATWRAVVELLAPDPATRSRLAIGGRSMGGRIASMLADEVGAAALVCLGYPFHPAGKPERLRTSHLEELRTSTLVVQGERDPMGRFDEVAGYRLSPSIELHWLADGDHSFRPRRTSGRTEAQNLGEATAAVIDFLTRVTSFSPEHD